MSDVKGFFSSKTIQAAILALGAGIAGLVGYSVTEADQSQLIELATSIAGIVGSIGAIYGRIVASKKIG